MKNLFGRVAKYVSGALVGIMLVATTAFGISDYGSSNVTRLWGAGSKFGCSASYIRSPWTNKVHVEEGEIAFVLTAGHCVLAGLDTAKRSIDDTVAAHVNWQVTVLSGRGGPDVLDFAFGTTPDIRNNKTAFWLGEKFPNEGVVYVHGFPYGVEKVTEAGVIDPDHYAFKYIQEQVPGSRLIAIPRRAVLPGSSGAPVLNTDGRVVGVVWGLMNDEVLPQQVREAGFSIAIITPIERVLEIVKALKKS